MSIELKELVGYLPYGLNFIAKGELYQMTEIQPHAIYEVWASVFFDEKKFEYVPKVNYRPSEMGRGFGINEIKPILHPLSDLTKEIEHNGERFVPIQKLLEVATLHGINKGIFEHVMTSVIENRSSISELPYYLIVKLHEWHFDIFGLIERGLVIDINTLSHA